MRRARREEILAYAAARRLKAEEAKRAESDRIEAYEDASRKNAAAKKQADETVERDRSLSAR